MQVAISTVLPERARATLSGFLSIIIRGLLYPCILKQLFLTHWQRKGSDSCNASGHLNGVA